MLFAGRRILALMAFLVSDSMLDKSLGIGRASVYRVLADQEAV